MRCSYLDRTFFHGTPTNTWFGIAALFFVIKNPLRKRRELQGMLHPSARAAAAHNVSPHQLHTASESINAKCGKWNLRGGVTVSPSGLTSGSLASISTGLRSHRHAPAGRIARATPRV